MPAFQDMTDTKHHSWEAVAEAVWKRYPAAMRFPERLNLEVISKRINSQQDEAVIERRVTYNYSAMVPIYLTANIQNADKFDMVETLTYNWVARTLTIDVVNESNKQAIQYVERTSYTADPTAGQDKSRTIIKQAGNCKCELPMFMDQFGEDMCRQIYHYNYTKNLDADATTLEERPHSTETTGYFPSYLRAFFLQDTIPALLPPLPPAHKPKDQGMSSADVKSLLQETDSKLSEEDAARKLAWIFSPTPPLHRGNNVMDKPPKVQVPSRLGHKGAGYRAMQPTLAPMHTFAPNAMSGPTAPALEIYGVARSSYSDVGAAQSNAAQGASSLVMF